jgi:hypothetical protein
VTPSFSVLRLGRKPASCHFLSRIPSPLAAEATGRRHQHERVPGLDFGSQKPVLRRSRNARCAMRQAQEMNQHPAIQPARVDCDELHQYEVCPNLLVNCRARAIRANLLGRVLNALRSDESDPWFQVQFGTCRASSSCGRSRAMGKARSSERLKIYTTSPTGHLECQEKVVDNGK